MESIWSRTAQIPGRKALGQDLKADVAVVGAGMAGILTAYFLQQAGRQVVVLEADRIAGGQTKNTTAKITLQHGLIYGTLLQQFGEDKAKQYAYANRSAIESFRQIIAAHSIACHFEDKQAYLYSTKDAAPLRQEQEAAQKLGIDMVFTTDTALPFEVKGALHCANQAQFHPLEFIGQVAKELTIYEHTRVLSAEGNQLMTPHGTVTAKQVVFATHFPFVNAPGYYFMRMHQERSYVLALEHATQLDGMYYGIDEDSYSLRNYGDYLFLGGENHRTGENKTGGRYDRLAAAAKRYFPQAREAARWSAQDCMPLDHVPYIGPYADSAPEWFVATGFGKWGMTGSMVSAMILSGLITGKETAFSEVFSPQRFPIAASAENLLADGKQAVKGLTKRIFQLPQTQAEALPLGHGGVVELEGEKAGVYKNQEGEIFVVDIKCPHLGCQLEWNPDEKSWDCPCHGSRFDYRGNLIDNPAQEEIH